MSYKKNEVTFLSKDSFHTVYGEIYTPKEKEPVGIVQLAHGMKDYVGRYELLADFLTDAGYVFAGHHHLGHGKTAEPTEDFGYFAKSGGIELVVRDMHTMNRILREKFPNLPVIAMGHSMGSFISRLYIERYPHTVQGSIIHGTGGPNPLLPFGSALASLISLFCGGRHVSKMLSNMAFGSYNSKFPKSEGKEAWLTRDTEMVAGRGADKFTNFEFTVSAYKDLFGMVKKSNSKEWFRDYPKDLPTLIISGDSDPVGNYGKGPLYVYKQLLISGSKDVTLKLYEGARHELFNETNRAEVFSDILSWIEGIK